MRQLYLISGLALIFLNLNSCNKSDNDDQNTCDKKVTISFNEYNNAPNDRLTISDLEIKNDCLRIKFSSSGCDGETWIIKLIDSGLILYSDPPQRNIKLSLKNAELCSAVIEKELTFDIRELQVSGNKVLLNINSNDEIWYEY